MPCVYLPGPASAVTVANTDHLLSIPFSTWRNDGGRDSSCRWMAESVELSAVINMSGPSSDNIQNNFRHYCIYWRLGKGNYRAATGGTSCHLVEMRIGSVYSVFL